ncbi:DUF3419 family protein [Paraglaciecola sp.]|uniref:DUF3419 family protein n=1 Tax=Paraglaciecola sp. TaxID=1920173 RepID=UPI00273DD14E|nr:DUF3419 family protein [Paraglaciecola sp.]MDP5030505.1 BtaA family protein [Paraglaciecola sp.]
MSLNYTFVNEDTSTELSILSPGSNILAIAGSGSRVVPLFMSEPKSICCVDTLKSQLYLTEMRIEAVRQLEYDDYCMLLGYKNSEPIYIQKLFDKLKISDDAKLFLEHHFKKFGWRRIIFSGKWERSIGKASSFFKLCVPDLEYRLSKCNNITEQEVVFAKTKFRIFLAFKILEFFTMMSCLIDMLKVRRKKINFKSSSTSVKHYWEGLNNIVHRKIVLENFFYSILLTGKYNRFEAPTLEIDANKYSRYKKGIENCQISYVHNDIFDFIMNTNCKFDFVSLSNTPDYLSKEMKFKFMQMLKCGLARNSKVVFRNCLSQKIKINTSGFDDVREEFSKPVKLDITPFYKVNIFRRSTNS